MWPFKRRKPTVPWEQIAAGMPPAPCGQQARHWQYIELEGIRCPICSAAERRREQLAERDALAKAIAREVVTLLRSSPPN